MLPKVLITNQIPSEVASPINGLATLQMGGSNHAPMSRQELFNSISDVTAIINQGEVRVDKELIEAAPQLKIVANVAIGTDNFDLDALTRRSVWATNAPGFFSPPVAEYAIAGMITVSRRLLEADAFVRTGEWSNFEPGRWDGCTLRDKTLGIVGFGQIGQALSALAKAFGMRVLSVDKGDGRELLLPMLGESDFVSIHVPHTEETVHLFGRGEFQVMKPNAILVNASRGVVVDQQALTEALERKLIRGAVLDVFEFEPSVPESLRSMKNVLLTPHIAGGTVESRRSTRLCAFENVAAALRGDRPPNALNDISMESILKKA
jgi:glyoxylate reductase